MLSVGVVRGKECRNILQMDTSPVVLFGVLTCMKNVIGTRASQITEDLKPIRACTWWM